MALTHEELRSRVDALIAAGDEQALETFLLEHFAELPEDIQGSLLFSELVETLESRTQDARLAELQEKALDALDVLSKDAPQA